MPFCNAFDKFNSPCLSNVPEGHDVCEQHTYFYGPRWFEKFIFAPDPNPRDFFFTSSSKVKAIYTKAILESRVKITKEHFVALEQSGKPLYTCVDYYILCCMQDGVDPLWSPALFTQAVKEILGCHSAMIYDSVKINPWILTRFLDPLLNTKARTFGNMMCHILYSAYCVDTKDYSIRHNIDAPGISLIQCIKRSPKFQSEFLWEFSDSEERLAELLASSEVVPGSLKEKIKQFFMGIKGLREEAREAQTEAFKARRDEIKEIAWMPERVVYWCLDTEQMKRIKEFLP